MGNCVSPPAPPSIPPDHPFLGSRIHSSSHGFGLASAVSSESRPFSFEMDAGTRRGLQTCPGEKLRETTSTLNFRPLSLLHSGHEAGCLPICCQPVAPLPPASSFQLCPKLRAIEELLPERERFASRPLVQAWPEG